MNYFLFAAALLILIDLVICAVLLCKGFALLRKPLCALFIWREFRIGRQRQETEDVKM